VSNLRECPACGGSNLEVWDTRPYAVHCACGMKGPCTPTEGLWAIELWNALPRHSELREACEIIRKLTMPISMLPGSLGERYEIEDRAHAFLVKHAKGSGEE
jgi:hypothetical protein